MGTSGNIGPGYGASLEPPESERSGKAEAQVLQLKVGMGTDVLDRHITQPKDEKYNYHTDAKNPLLQQTIGHMRLPSLGEATKKEMIRDAIIAHLHNILPQELRETLTLELAKPPSEQDPLYTSLYNVLASCALVFSQVDETLTNAANQTTEEHREELCETYNKYMGGNFHPNAHTVSRHALSAL